jgi:hypothetical protein
VLLQASDIKIDDVAVKFEESAKLRPLIMMTPPPESAILIGSLELTTGAANPIVRETWMKEMGCSDEYRRT